jgi:hypothetical protein
MSKPLVSRTAIFAVSESMLNVEVERNLNAPAAYLTVRINDGEDSFVFSCTPEFAAKMAEALKDAAL